MEWASLNLKRVTWSMELCYAKNSGGPLWSRVPLPKAMCFFFYSSIKWHLWINKISFKCWKPHTVGAQGLGDGSTCHLSRHHAAVLGRVGVGVKAGVGKERSFKKSLVILLLIVSLNKCAHHLKRDMSHFLHAMKCKSTWADLESSSDLHRLRCLHSFFDSNTPHITDALVTYR